MYLFKYLSSSGVCSRRKVADLIESGAVKVNGKVVDTIFYLVKSGDLVECRGKSIVLPELIYVLLNKPKDYITTLSDDKGRRTVIDLLPSGSLGRIYPVGRLDRQTTGLLLLTNDGQLTQKLSHPSYMIQKGYRVVLNKVFTKTDFDKLSKGIYLEDGHIRPDSLAYAQAKSSIELYIHSGKNRIVRRIFESLGYRVKKLDRFSFAGLTKKGLSLGKFRFLGKSEINKLKDLVKIK